MKNAKDRSVIPSQLCEHIVDICEKCEDKVRVCSVCGEIMTQGFCIAGGESYYCSEDCLHTEMTDKEYEDLYEEEGETYWTEWN